MNKYLHPPLEKLHITSPFGWRVHPTQGGRKHHDGIDLRAPLRTEVWSPISGRVVRVDQRHEINGNALFIRGPHPWSTERMPRLDLVVCLLHLEGFAAKDEPYTFIGLDDEVLEGQYVAASGQTGRSTAPHLHLQIYQVVRVKNTSRGPSGYLRAPTFTEHWDVIDPTPFFKWPEEPPAALAGPAPIPVIDTEGASEAPAARFAGHTEVSRADYARAGVNPYLTRQPVAA